MKVLMINVVCGIRSTGRICTDLADELVAQGHEVKIAYGRETVPEKYQKYAVRIGSDFGVKINALKARVFDNEGLNAVRATRKFITWVKQYDPDVIHLHNIHGYYLNYKILFEYLRTCGKKILWTLHDCWVFTGHTAYCDAVGCTRWKDGCYKCPQVKEYPKAFIDRSKRNWKEKKQCFTGIPNLTVVTPSNWLSGLVKQSFLSEYRVEVIHNGIDTAQFMPLANDFKEYHGIEGKTMILGVASSWDDNKGYSDYLKLANMLGNDYQIVLVGVTDEQQKHLPQNVLGIKRTNSVKELALIYSAADCLLNLSKTENYPTINLEAMCCGTPVITYDVGGSKESVLPAGGVVVEKGNLIMVAEAIKSRIPECQFDRTSFDNVRFVQEYVQIAQNRGGYFATKAGLNLSGKYVILGVAAIWDKRKGLDDFIATSDMLPDGYQIIVVGVSQKQSELLPEKMVGISRTNNTEELRELYSIADVFINPTYEDNYPTTNLEAKSCGTKVITYRTGGSPESADVVIDHGVENMVKTIMEDDDKWIRNDVVLDKLYVSKEYVRLVTSQ